jgi:hypothetical protein
MQRRADNRSVGQVGHEIAEPVHTGFQVRGSLTPTLLIDASASLPRHIRKPTTTRLNREPQAARH